MQNHVKREEVATEYERALMIRLIGPHQGIRLERVRAELDDEIELGEVALTGEEDDLGPVVTTPDQTDYTKRNWGYNPPRMQRLLSTRKATNGSTRVTTSGIATKEKTRIKWELRLGKPSMSSLKFRGTSSPF